MALEDEILEGSSEVIFELGKIGLWLEAIGILVVLWIIFYIFLLIGDRKKQKIIESIQKDLKRIERKIDSLKKSGIKK